MHFSSWSRPTIQKASSICRWRARQQVRPHLEQLGERVLPSALPLVGGDVALGRAIALSPPSVQVRSQLTVRTHTTNSVVITGSKESTEAELQAAVKAGLEKAASNEKDVFLKEMMEGLARNDDDLTRIASSMKGEFDKGKDSVTHFEIGTYSDGTTLDVGVVNITALPEESRQSQLPAHEAGHAYIDNTLITHLSQVIAAKHEDDPNPAKATGKELGEILTHANNMYDDVTKDGKVGDQQKAAQAVVWSFLKQYSWILSLGSQLAEQVGTIWSASYGDGASPATVGFVVQSTWW